MTQLSKADLLVPVFYFECQKLIAFYFLGPNWASDTKSTCLQTAMGSGFKERSLLRKDWETRESVGPGFVNPCLVWECSPPKIHYNQRHPDTGQRKLRSQLP